MTAIPEVQRSAEVLTHFRCVDPRCEQWWSIADFDLQKWGCLYIHCPRCGRLYRLEPAATEPGEADMDFLSILDARIGGWEAA